MELVKGAASAALRTALVIWWAAFGVAVPAGCDLSTTPHQGWDPQPFVDRTDEYLALATAPRAIDADPSFKGKAIVIDRDARGLPCV